MKNNWKEAIVTSKVQHTESIYSLFLKTVGNEVFHFIPGQFVTLDLPISDVCIKRWRSYSIASAIQDVSADYDFEVLISKYRSGPGSLYLADEVSEGDILRYKGPAGSFILDYEEDNSLIMICTETGIAPCRSMLRSMEFEDKFPASIELIHNVDNVEQLIYKNEMCHLRNIIPNFKFSANVSGDKYWLGIDKDLPLEVIEKYQDRRGEVKFYICGWPEMVKNTIAMLINDMGFEKNQISYQIYR